LPWIAFIDACPVGGDQTVVLQAGFECFSPRVVEVDIGMGGVDRIGGPTGQIGSVIGRRQFVEFQQGEIHFIGKGSGLAP
jgi:hypothetical protein